MFKILIVDDESLIRKVLSRTLKKIGDCQTAISGKEAISEYTNALLNNKPFDLILLDIAMKNMTGYEVLTEIRNMEMEKEIPDNKKVKIIMVTGISDVEVVKKCISAGCNGYIIKPITSDIILDKVKELGLLKM